MENVYEYQMPQFEQEAREAAKTEVSLGIAGAEKKMRLGSMSIGQLRGVAALLNIGLCRITLEPVYGNPGKYQIHQDGVRGRIGGFLGVWVQGPREIHRYNEAAFKSIASQIRKQCIMIAIARVMATRERQKARRQAYATAR